MRLVPRPLRLFWFNLRHKLRQAARRRARPQPAATPPPPGPPRVEYSYTIYWTKQVRRWDLERRTAMRSELEAALAQPGFEANAYERRYRLAGLDDQAHSGASLLALRKVLNAFAKDEG